MHDGHQFGRQVRPDLIDGREVPRHDLKQHAVVVGVAEGQARGEQLVEHDAHRVDVGAPVDLLSHGLLDAHVIRGSHDRPRARERHVLLIHALELGDAEVEDLDLGHVGGMRLVEEHVLWFHVAVDDALEVGGLQRVEDRADHVGGQRNRHGADLLEQTVEALALEQLHGDERNAVGVGAGVDDLDDVGMSDQGRGLGFAPDAGEDLVVARERVVQQLERDHAVGQHVLCEVDGAHATFAEQPVKCKFLDGFATAVRHVTPAFPTSGALSYEESFQFPLGKPHPENS